MQVYRFVSYLTLTLLLFISSQVQAQEISDTSKISGIKGYPTRQFYFTDGFDAGLLQVSEVVSLNRSKLSTLRFSYFFNISFNFNYDLSKRAGFFTGLGIKNIGFIDKIADSTVKRRVYTIGAPIGVKFGNLGKRKFAFAGGGLDIPFHYKEKGFKNRSAKKKESEWFSDKPSFLMPYVFVGASVNKAIELKLQFYPMDFMNSSYTIPTTAGYVYPFASYNAQNLFYLSIGINPGAKAMGKRKKKDNAIPQKMS